MIEYGPLIHAWRLRRRLTQTELAKQVGIPQPNLSNIERGKQDITVSTLERISIALGVKPVQLMEWEEARSVRKKLIFTRRSIERLANAVVKPDSGLGFAERRVARLFSQVLRLPDKTGYGFKKTIHAWAELKVYMTNQEIQTLHQRVLDVLVRKK